jgi:hypothetical protein
MLYVTVAPAHHVSLERREQCLAVPLESERAWLVQALDHRLAQATTEGPTDEPLQLDTACLANRQQVCEAGVDVIRAHAGALEL